MRRRLVLGALMLGLAVVVSGSAVTAGGRTPAGELPLYGVLSGSPPYREPLVLTRLHPRTLAPVRSRQLAVPRRMVLAGRSPDGRLAAFFERQPAAVRVIDLETMRIQGELPLRLGKRWRIREAAWLTADRLVFVVQRLRGSYEQIVDTRQVVVVDPLALRVVARTPFANAMALHTAAHGGDRLVLLLGRGDRRDNKHLLAVISSSGDLRTTEFTLGGTAPSFPALAVEPSGKRALAITADTSVVDVDLDSLQVVRQQVTGAAEFFAPRTWAGRAAIRLDEHTLAVYGSNTSVTRSGSASVPAGVVLLDTRNWQARVIDPQASGATFSAGTLVTYGVRQQPQSNARKATRPMLTGIGLRAYDPSGAPQWRRYGGQPLAAQAWGDVAVVHEPSITGHSRVFPIELSSGRRLAPTRERNLWLLPQPAEGRRALAAAAKDRHAIEVEGDSQEIAGTAREDVTRVSVVLVNGTEQELALEPDGFAYRAPSPEQSVRVVQAYAGEQLVATVSLPVRCGGAAGPCAAPAATAEAPAYAVIGGVPTGGSTLARVDPRTLRPIGASLALRDPYVYPHARSPDGTKVALTTYKSSLIRIADLEQMKVVRELRLPGSGEARSLHWVANDRLIAIAQRMSKPTRRYVRERTATTLDPGTGEIVARRPLTNKLAVSGIGVGGGRVVVLLRSSLGKGSTVELAVVDSDGRVRARAFEVGRRRGGALNRPSLAVEQSGRRAFLLVPPDGRETPPLFEIDLETLSVSRRKLRVEPEGELPPAAIGGGVYVEAATDRHLVAAGAVAANTVSDPGPFPAAGVFLIDTVGWVARQLDPRALYFQLHGGNLITYGPANGPRGLDRGAGVSVYELSGRRLAHLYANRRFSRLEFAGGYGHILLDPPRTKRLVFDARAGKPLGMLPALRQRIEVLAPPPSPAPRRATAAAPPAASPHQSADPFTRVSNRGTRVQPEATRPGEREHTPRDLFLLRRDEGRAVYRIGGLRAGYTSCYATGRASEIGRLGMTACGRARSTGFPSRAQPILDLSGIQLRRGQKTPNLFRLEGLAADAIAEIGLLDADGEEVERVPVEANVYLLAAPPREANGDLVAYDRDGRIVFRSDRRAERNPPPPSTSAGALAGFRLKLRLPTGWSGEIRRSGAGPFRALVFASNRLSTRNARSVNVALSERDPREKPAYPTLTRPPRLDREDVRPTKGGRGRGERRFTLNGRQFKLQLFFGAARPPATSLAAVNRLLASLEVGAIAVPLTIDTSQPPLQRGRAEGVLVDVYRSGTVVFRFDPASRLYRQLDGKHVSLACVTFDSVSPWEPNEAWTTRPLAPTVQVRISEATRPQQPYATLDPATEARAPFDGCLVSGSYGRRWNDPRGQHSPAEIGFTRVGARFFAERAVARDLALFIRSPKLSAIRRAMKRGAPAPAAMAIARRFPVRVRALSGHDSFAAVGTIGVRTSGRDVIEISQRTPGGRKLFVRLRAGRIGHHNLQGLAFVF
jgi:hypothetical protein